MPPSVTGDFAKLAAMIERFEKIASPGMTRPLLDLLAHRMLEQVEEGFASTTDPYRRTWAPLASGEARPVLTKTGAMRGSFSAQVGNDRITIRNPVRDSRGRVYADYHQTGTRNMPRRRTVPEADELADWANDLMHIADWYMRTTIGFVP